MDADIDYTLMGWTPFWCGVVLWLPTMTSTSGDGRVLGVSLPKNEFFIKICLQFYINNVYELDYPLCCQVMNRKSSAAN